MLDGIMGFERAALQCSFSGGDRVMWAGVPVRCAVMGRPIRLGEYA